MVDPLVPMNRYIEKLSSRSFGRACFGPRDELLMRLQRHEYFPRMPSQHIDEQHLPQIDTVPPDFSHSHK